MSAAVMASVAWVESSEKSFAAKAPPSSEKSPVVRDPASWAEKTDKTFAALVPPLALTLDMSPVAMAPDVLAVSSDMTFAERAAQLVSVLFCH